MIGDTEPALRPPSAADKTLWGFLRLLAPRAIQEITLEATHAEQRATICGWLRVHGRWFWHRPTNTLLRANSRFWRAWHRAEALDLWDAQT